MPPATKNDQFLLYEQVSRGMVTLWTVYGNLRTVTRCRYPAWYPPLHEGVPRESGPLPKWPVNAVDHPAHARIPCGGLEGLLSAGVVTAAARARVKQWLAYPLRSGLEHRRGLMAALAAHPDWAPYLGRMMHVIGCDGVQVPRNEQVRAVEGGTI